MPLKRFILVTLLFLLATPQISFCKGLSPKGTVPYTTNKTEDPMPIKLTSPAFKEGELMPAKYTGDRENISPQLEWFNVPENTKSIAIICDDPDAWNKLV